MTVVRISLFVRATSWMFYDKFRRKITVISSVVIPVYDCRYQRRLLLFVVVIVVFIAYPFAGSAISSVISHVSL